MSLLYSLLNRGGGGRGQEKKDCIQKLVPKFLNIGIILHFFQEAAAAHKIEHSFHFLSHYFFSVSRVENHIKLNAFFGNCWNTYCMRLIS